MNAHTTVNTALKSRGLLPVDGHCECAKCHRTGLNRDQLADVKPTSRIATLVERCGGPVCHQCEELLWIDHENGLRVPPQSRVGKCPDCEGTGVGGKYYHYVRGHGITEWCVTCNGEG